MTAMTPTAARVALAVVLASAVVFSLTAPGHGAASAQTPGATPTPTCPPGEFYDPIMDRCRLIRVECPAGKIDVRGDGTLCESLDSIPQPGFCIGWPGSAALPPVGQANCALPWSLGGQAVSLSASVGCLDVRRNPFPRAMVNLPVELQVSRILPPDQLSGIAFGAPGSYRLVAGEPWSTAGLYLHEVYGAGASDSLGRPAFNTRILLGADPYPYPSINNVRARLVLRLAADSGSLSWSTAGFPQTHSDGLSSPVRLTYRRASFPLPGLEAHYSPFGPNAAGHNSLPAYRLTLRSLWQLYLQAEWDTYTVTPEHAYARAGHAAVEAPIGSPYLSFRAWDVRQTPVPGVFCNAADGYLPVPVIEGQTVLRP